MSGAKNSVIGGSVVLGSAILSAALFLRPNTPVRADPPGKDQILRYQISAGGSAAYVIDTVTGKVWLHTDQDFEKPKREP